jgi:hypothetical protein
MMRYLIIQLSTGEYLKSVRIGSNYLDYELTTQRDQAEKLGDYDSKLVLTRLDKKATREETHSTQGDAL